MSIPRDQWRWSGMAGHWCMGDRCRFHLRTEVGDFLVSTVGEAVSSDPKEKGYVTCGSGPEIFETMVFPLGGEPCARQECGCGDREPASYTEIDAQRYLTRGEATRGHLDFCERYADLAPESMSSTNAGAAP